MPTLRKANAYSKRKVAPFTRWSKRRTKGYIKMVPPQKIVKFCMGKTKAYLTGKLSHVLTVCTTEKIQIRNNAMEACRQFINKKLNLEFNGNYFFQVVPFPHHIQREHRMLTGAGADRMSSGMQLSFGKSMNKAAILKVGAPIFVIAVSSARGAQFARQVVKKTKAKLPCKIKIDQVDLNKQKAEQAANVKADQKKVAAKAEDKKPVAKKKVAAKKVEEKAVEKKE